LDLTYALPSIINFSRASSGTYIDAQGKVKTAAANVPRFDYHPVSLKPLGFLSEAPATNFLCWSNSLSTSGGSNNWFYGSVEFQGYVEAPSGLLEAPQFEALDKTPYGSFVVNTPDITTSGNWTFSVWLKRLDDGEGDSWVILQLDEENYVEFEISNKWTRYSLFGFTAYPDVGVFIQTEKTKVAVWGAQLETGSFESSLIMTENSLATRAGDFADLSGKSLATRVGQEGTFLVVGDRYDTSSATGRMMALQSVSFFSDEISASITNTGGRLRIIHRGSTQANLQGFAFPTNQTGVAFRYGTNDAMVYVNGAAGSPDVSVIVPTFDIMRIGHVATSATAWDWIRGHVSRIKYWPSRFGNAQLQRISVV
jgi:hypothetical protein